MVCFANVQTIGTTVYLKKNARSCSTEPFEYFMGYILQTDALLETAVINKEGNAAYINNA